jgi:hypothetical protein
VRIGEAALAIDISSVEQSFSEDDFPESGWDVLAGVTIYVGRASKAYWGANLWYMRRSRAEEYRWHQVEYSQYGSGERRPETGLMALTDLSGADLAASGTTQVYQVARGPFPIDDEDFPDFCDLWISRLARAYDGKLP